jgi:hypothetical protein
LHPMLAKRHLLSLWLVLQWLWQLLMCECCEHANHSIVLQGTGNQRQVTRGSPATYCSNTCDSHWHCIHA